MVRIISWNSNEKGGTNNRLEDDNLDTQNDSDYFSHHSHHLKPQDSEQHSHSTSSTIEANDTKQQPITKEKCEYCDEPKHETFNTQLKRRLSSLGSNKKTLHPKPSKDGPCNHCKRAQKKCEEEECQNDLCNCLIDEQDDQVKELVSPTAAMTVQHSLDSAVISPTSITEDSSLIFERNVQDQIPSYEPCTCVSSESRRNSINPLNHHAARSMSFSSQSSIPTHLSSEFYVPQVLDASAEVLHDPNYESYQVIHSNNNIYTTLLDQSKNYTSSIATPSHPGMGNRRTSRSLPITRRQSSSTTVPLSPTSTSTSMSTTMNNQNSQNVDYSDRKKLNFCSYADLLSDESESDVLMLSPASTSPTRTMTGTGGHSILSAGTTQQLKDPFSSINDQLTSDSNRTIMANHPMFPSLSKTSSIKEILLETQSELDKSDS